MDENKMRQLERQYKLRVKTGCETCRTRRIKCDETKPECVRCTKTGRKCAGYSHVHTARQGSPAAAASFRNPSFLVVPQKSSQTSIVRNPSGSLSPDSMEVRSFHYFQSHTLPKWTEFFDSDLWSQKILQLSHLEPAIKHGVLALSVMHERFERPELNLDTKSNDFAFMQYMRAVRQSNDLLVAHQEGRADVEKVLIACIIFTCYENLAGNYRAANMHLRNGLRILKQEKTEANWTPSRESITNVLRRFDLQAMTFSDNASPYEYSLDSPPELPQMQEVYTTNADARNDLVCLFRCIMWISGTANINPQAPENPQWLQMYTHTMASFRSWVKKFEMYLENLPLHEKGDTRIFAGNTLLKMYSLIARLIIAGGAGLRTEMVWDAFIDSFKTILDLAETLPILSKPSSNPSSRVSASPPPPPTTPIGAAPLTKHRVLAPNPATPSPSPPPGASTFIFQSNPPQPTSQAQMSFTQLPLRSKTPPSQPSRPTSFSPSFELSPIIPLFLVACRCRDPIIRRRALALLLSSRRREGTWDSYGAGMVALQCVKLEEGLDQAADLGDKNWLPTSVKVKEAADVEERRRVQDIFCSVNLAENIIGVNYLLRSGETVNRYVRI